MSTARRICRFGFSGTVPAGRLSRNKVANSQLFARTFLPARATTSCKEATSRQARAAPWNRPANQEIEMKKQRRGFSMIEILIVMLIMGLMAAIAFPRGVEAIRTASRRAAQQQVAAYLARARALAIQRGRRAEFQINGSVMQVTVDQNGAQVVVG